MELNELRIGQVFKNIDIRNGLGNYIKISNIILNSEPEEILFKILFDASDRKPISSTYINLSLKELNDNYKLILDPVFSNDVFFRGSEKLTLVYLSYVSEKLWLKKECGEVEMVNFLDFLEDLSSAVIIRLNNLDSIY